MLPTPIEVGPAIIIMAKLPTESDVKTRLGTALTPQERAELAECFLRDTLDNSLRAANSVYLAYSASRESGEELMGLERNGVQSFRQVEGSLGHRMASAVALVANNGHSPMIVVGTDSPMMNQETLETAINAFRDETIEMVIGPSEDGGYYLIGLRRAIPELFENILWDGDSVYKDTLSQARRLGIKHLIELPVSYDIDTPDDLFRLFREHETAAGRKRISPETCRWLTANRYVLARERDQHF